jgi:ABC-type multidrug transport system fused ATPase/permease subunit
VSTVDDRWRGIAEHRDEDGPGGGPTRTRTRRLIGELLRPYRRTLWLLLATITTQNLAWLAGPLLIGVGIDVAVPALVSGDPWPLVWITVAMVAAALADAGLRFLFLTRSGRVGQAMLLELRRRVFLHLQRLPLSFHERYTSGRAISRLTSDVEALDELLDEGLDNLLTAAFSVLTIGVVLVVLDPPLGLVSLLGFPVLFWLTRWFQQQSTLAYRRTRETVAALIVHFTETFGGIRAVQAFRREPRNDQLHEALNEDNRQAHDRAFWLMAVFIPAVTLVGNLTTVAVLGYGSWRVLDGTLAVGTLVSFLLYLRRFFDPLQDIAMFYNAYQSAAAALDKLSGLLAERPTVAEPTDPVPLPAARGSLAFEDVRFGYTDRTVLHRLDLDVPAGQTVALVGATGAGKSTVARLAARFYDPVEGRVLLDGVPLDRLADADLRRAVVMVTQESFLFSGTVADNIGFGRPGASRADVEEAARAIGAHDFIAALPEGYDTDVHKRGGRLSAGQRQLVSFARAFLADPAVLILDEATSSLDVPSERLVQHALRTLLADRTALIIAHRLSTVEIADRVLVMAGGRLVEDGAPGDLVDGTGDFADLHRAWADSLVVDRLL